MPQNTVDAESPDEFIPDDVPYSRIETEEDGTQVIQYYVEVMHPKTEIITYINGREEVRTVMVTMVEERSATVPPGEDISEFLSGHADGKIVNREPSAHFDEYVEPAPLAPSES